MQWTISRPIIASEFIQQKLSCSKSKVHKLFALSKVTLDGKVLTQPHKELQTKQVVVYQKDRLKTPFEILYEDEFIICVNKPAGILSIATGKKVLERNLYHQVYQYIRDKTNYKQRIFVVHRLDKNTSGVIIFAKEGTVKDELMNQWISFKKFYRAWVLGSILVKEKVLKSFLEVKNEFVTVANIGERSNKNHLKKNNFKGNKKSLKSNSGNDLKYAESKIRLLKKTDLVSELEVQIKTGRKNQIRVHLAQFGHPILGDKKYGKKSPIHHLYLHCEKINFYHPIHKKWLSITAPLPNYFYWKKVNRQLEK